MKNLLVYCGAAIGKPAVYRETAEHLGRLLAERQIGLIYGGGSIGLMGVLANSVLQHGGHVLGVIPGFLNQQEVGHRGLSDLRIVTTMHERKALMEQECDAVLALAGGLGTLDELFEMLTWSQLGLHRKPIALLNTNEYYTHLLHQLDKMIEDGFLSTSNRHLLLTAHTPEQALDVLEIGNV